MSLEQPDLRKRNAGRGLGTVRFRDPLYDHPVPITPVPVEIEAAPTSILAGMYGGWALGSPRSVTKMYEQFSGSHLLCVPAPPRGGPLLGGKGGGAVSRGRQPFLTGGGDRAVGPQDKLQTDRHGVTTPSVPDPSVSNKELQWYPHPPSLLHGGGAGLMCTRVAGRRHQLPEPVRTLALLGHSVLTQTQLRVESGPRG